MKLKSDECHPVCRFGATISLSCERDCRRRPKTTLAAGCRFLVSVLLNIVATCALLCPAVEVFPPQQTFQVMTQLFYD